MVQKELDKNYNSVMLLDRDIVSIENQIQKIKDSIWEIADEISSASKPIAKYSAKQFKVAKNKDDLKLATMTAVVSIAVDGVGKTFGFVGSILSDIKGEYKLQKLRSKKKEIALSKIGFAEKTLTWGKANESKLATILYNDLSIVVNNYKVDSELYFETRQNSLDNYMKCLTIIRMSEFLIETYKAWINNVDNLVEKPSKQVLIQFLFSEKSNVFHSKLTREYFIGELQKQSLRADVLLLLQNEMFFNMLPLSSDEIYILSKKLEKTSIPMLALSGNQAYLDKCSKEKGRKKSKFISLFIIIATIVLLYFSLNWGWWNIIVIPFELILLLIAVFLFLE
jgi:hypothetical protein